MNLHNEHGIEPGVYRHHKGDYFVVTDLITHKENATTGDMESLAPGEMLIVYRDKVPFKDHVNGKVIIPHRVYSMTVNEFFSQVNDKPRFTKE